MRDCSAIKSRSTGKLSKLYRENMNTNYPLPNIVASNVSRSDELLCHSVSSGLSVPWQNQANFSERFMRTSITIMNLIGRQNYGDEQPSA